MRFRRSIVIALSLGTACCVAPKPAPTPPVATPAPRPTSTPTPTPVATYDSWMDVPQTPGDWRYAQIANGSAARYGEGGSEPRFSLVCTGNRRIELVRHGPFTADALMTVRTEHASRNLTTTRTPDNAAVRAVLAATDPLLDAMAFSKGRFAIETPGAPALYLPSWPEVTRVIEDCR